MLSPLRISAKNLGSLALPSFCPRCFWIRMHAENKLPYQIFPGIFSSIDSYGKRLVHGWFDRHGSPPPWLSGLGEIRGYLKPPHASKFSVRDEDASIVLSGSPDGILIRKDDSRLIIDYKTAKFTEHQDALFPMYEVQLNAYAYIGERCGLAPIAGLALIYTEPETTDAAAGDEANITGQGFRMGFSAHILPVRLQTEMIPPLLRKVRDAFNLPHPPESSPGCEDCPRLDNLMSIAST